MSDAADLELPSAAQLSRKVAEVFARKAAEAEAERSLHDQERAELIERLAQPMEPTPEAYAMAARHVRTIVDAAAQKGERRALLFRFPNALTTDHGRAINVREAGWESSLTGRPRQIVRYWEKTLKPLGYGLSAEVLEFPGGMPGDIGLFLSWE